MRTNDATKKEGRVNLFLHCDTMFGHRAEIREMPPKVIEKFRQWGATSPHNAMSICESGDGVA